MTDWPPQRLLPPAPDSYTPDQRAAAAAFLDSPRKAMQGPLPLWLHRPEMAQAVHRLARYARFETSLGPRLSELAIITTARVWRAEFEWYAHAPLALEAGVPAAVVEAIRTGAEPPFDTAEDAVVHAFARDAAQDRTVGEALYDRTMLTLGRDRLIDLLAVIGYYGLVSLTLNTFQVMPPPDAPRAFD